MNSAVARVVELEEAPAPAGPLRPFDVRLRREIAHRRLVISMVRRFMRITGLHALDGAMLIGTVALLGSLGAGYAALSGYMLTITAISLLSLNALSSYEPGDGRRDQRRLLLGVLLSLLILTCLVMFPPYLELSLPVLGALGVAIYTTLSLGRAFADRLVRQVYVRGIGLRRALMVGGLEEVGNAIERLRGDRPADQYIDGHIALDPQSDPTALGGLTDLARILEERDIQEVIVATSLPAAAIRQVAECCFDHGAALYTIPTVTDLVDCRVEPLRMGACPLMRLHPARLEVPSLLLKRAYDLVIASIMLVLTLPLMGLIALAIKLDSPGPVFFRAKRVGLGGQLFSMWKFRSMLMNAAEREKELAHMNMYKGGTFKVRDDPRVTRVGKLLRRTSLDELPQLFNVLQGQMSLVGPRPALVSDLERYEPHHFERLSVIPGITGAWQVGGRNLITDFETIFRLDRSYIRRWSLLLDVKIMLRTLKVVITGEGAY